MAPPRAGWARSPTAAPPSNSLADKALSVSVVAWLALLFPGIWRDQPLAVAAVGAALLGAGLLGWRRFGRVPPLHLLSGRLGGACQALFTLHAFWSGAYSRPLLALALGAGALAALEEVVVLLGHPQPDQHIRSALLPPARAVLVASGRRWLASRWLPAWLAALAVVLTLPALATGWHFDDYLQRALLTAPGVTPQTAAGQLFVFMDGDPAHAQRLMDDGFYPWWTLPAGQNTFWRPLAALSHWLDYQLWPTLPALMHFHSLLWLALLVTAVALLYRRLLGSTAVAGLAALLYAVDDTHGYAAAWLANRNALMATVGGCLALLAHDQWRRTGWRRAALLAPLLLLLALLSAEAAVATLGYLVAYAVFLDRGEWWRRLRSLGPALLTTAAWRLIYRRLGYGAFGTAYIDPAAEPLRFARAVVARAPLLLAGQWAPVPAEAAALLAGTAVLAAWAAALVVVALVAWAAGPLIRRDRVARFWALGLLLAGVPACGALPANRLLTFVGIGAMGLTAQLVARPPRRWVRPALVAVHLVAAPALLPLTAYSPALLGDLSPASRSLPAASGSAQTTILLGAPSFFSASYLPLVRAQQGLAPPGRLRVLAAGPGPTTLIRLDDYTVLARPAQGYLVGFDTVFRDPSQLLVVGTTVRLADVTVTVVALTADGRPAAAQFRFAAPLDSPALRWFQWRPGGYVAAAPPATGAPLTVPGSWP